MQRETCLQAAEERVAAASADAGGWQQALSEAEVRAHAAQQELQDRRAERAQVHMQLQKMAAEVRGACRVRPGADIPSSRQPPFGEELCCQWHVCTVLRMGLLFFELLLFLGSDHACHHALQMQQLQERLVDQNAVCEQQQDELEGAKVWPMHTNPAQLICSALWGMLHKATRLLG